MPQTETRGRRRTTGRRPTTKTYAQLYRDAAAQILALEAGQAMPDQPLGMPTVEDGVAGSRFMPVVMASHRQDTRWVDL